VRSSGFHRRCNGFHHDTFPCVVFIDLFDETFVPPDSQQLKRADLKIRLNKRIKRFNEFQDSEFVD